MAAAAALEAELEQAATPTSVTADDSSAAGFIATESTQGSSPVCGLTRAGASSSTRRHLGTVKCWKRDQGFGFIARDDGEKDLFMHHRAIQPGGKLSLQIGMRVEFDETVSYTHLTLPTILLV